MEKQLNTIDNWIDYDKFKLNQLKKQLDKIDN